MTTHNITSLLPERLFILFAVIDHPSLLHRLQFLNVTKCNEVLRTVMSDYLDRKDNRNDIYLVLFSFVH